MDQMDQVDQMDGVCEAEPPAWMCLTETVDFLPAVQESMYM